MRVCQCPTGRVLMNFELCLNNISLSVLLSVCLSVCLSLSACSFVCPSICSSVSLTQNGYVSRHIAYEHNKSREIGVLSQYVCLHASRICGHFMHPTSKPRMHRYINKFASIHRDCISHVVTNLYVSGKIQSRPFHVYAFSSN